MSPLVPVLLLGGVLLLTSKPTRKGQKALPAPNSRGRIYTPGDVDVIVAKKGETFTIALESLPGAGYLWELAASPADDSIKFLKKESLPDHPGEIGGPAIEYFYFKAVKSGEGSLVFHYRRPWLKDEQPPEDEFEIQARITN